MAKSDRNQQPAPHSSRSFATTQWPLVHAAGERFLVLLPNEQKQEEDRGPIEAILVLNWFEELKQRVPREQ